MWRGYHGTHLQHWPDCLYCQGRLTKLRAINSRNGAPTVYVEGIIGDPHEGTTNGSFREQLLAVQGAPCINVEINSDGGVITEGQAMYAALRQFPGRTVGLVTGIAASMASVLLQGCTERRVAKGAFVMIHLAQGGARGTPEDLRSQADAIEKMQSELLDIYETRTGMQRDAIVAMLKRETYMTAEEAVQLGFADMVETFEARVTYPAVARLQRDASPLSKKLIDAIESRGRLVITGDAAARAAAYKERAKGNKR